MQLAFRQHGSAVLSFVPKRPFDDLVNHQICAFAHVSPKPHLEPEPDSIPLVIGGESTKGILSASIAGGALQAGNLKVISPDAYSYLLLGRF